MICKHCGAVNREDALFCMQCGKALEKEKVPQKSKIFEKKYIVYIGILATVLIVIALVCILVKTSNDRKKSSDTIQSDASVRSKDEEAGQTVAEEDTTVSEYLELVQKGDSLVESDTEQAVNQYEAAIELIPDREDAYMKLLKLYVANENIAESQALIERIQSNVTDIGSELQAMLDDESQKNWYVVGAKVSVYEVDNDKTDAYKLVAGEMTTSLSAEYTFYYKYDDQGRLIETNAGSLPSIYAKNDGAYRMESSISVIDSDEFARREGDDADYIMFVGGRGKYYFPDTIDDQNTFTFEYKQDGSVMETVSRNGDVVQKNEYTFDGKRISAQTVYASNGTENARYSDFSYRSDYVSFYQDGKKRYWEESYDGSGKLNGMTLEIDASYLDFVASRQAAKDYFGGSTSLSKVKFKYYYDDVTDDYGNISRRTQKYDLIGGIRVGRNSDGTYFDWGTLQTGIWSKVVDYEYAYCKPSEINEKTGKGSVATEQAEAEDAAGSEDSAEDESADTEGSVVEDGDVITEDPYCAGYNILIPKGFAFNYGEDSMLRYVDANEGTYLIWGGACEEDSHYEKEGYQYYTDGETYLSFKDSSSLSYSNATKDYCCCSWQDESGTIYYEAFHFDEELTYGFEIRYLEENKEYYDPLVQKLSQYITKNEGRMK